MIRGDPSAGVSESLAKGVEPVESEVFKFRSVGEEEVVYIANLSVDSLVIVNDDGVIGLSDNCK